MSLNLKVVKKSQLFEHTAGHLLKCGIKAKLLHYGNQTKHEALMKYKMTRLVLPPTHLHTTQLLLTLSKQTSL